MFNPISLANLIQFKIYSEKPPKNF